MKVEAERIAAHSAKWTMPRRWVAADEFERVDGVLETDPSVNRIIESSEFTDQKSPILTGQRISRREWTNMTKRESIPAAGGVC